MSIKLKNVVSGQEWPFDSRDEGKRKFGFWILKFKDVNKSTFGGLNG